MSDTARVAEPLTLELDLPGPADGRYVARAGVPFALRVRGDLGSPVPAEVLVLGAGVRATPVGRDVRLPADATFLVCCSAAGPAHLHVELLVGGEEMASAAAYLSVLPAPVV
ncbi:hypothetical protein GobsT_11880 [Gemmata obscuriglobus]|uniref:Uncharacterized protein n=1 Tax=Gemmata obscuriglobus TaxID=114 RepID=A0A2Z3H9Y0_9BACT|nr:hypothetical protein [Gemmata obscuriglobus]AWM40337.1 hypothetical protein C1280_27255 [Gemmata obscuriglobus]QEG26449.1 hypothetical protein GobsT_11880 [Gemmata obscuriglobus]VTS01635.1 unnamed protein product [Gemmata obscuriglobus UQM 2246]